jgi:hypothetical protein
VTTLLDRIAGAFYVAPGADRKRPAARRRVAVAPAVAVLAPAADVDAAGGALAAALARECRAAAAVVCTWTAGAARPRAPQAPATGAAHRLAAALARRGHAARASRHLVLVALAAEEDAAIAEAARVAAACGSVPVVLAIGGPRGRPVDDALRMHDLVVIAGDPAVAELAGVSVARLGVRVSRYEPPASPLSRLLAAAGVATGTAARAAVRRAVSG